MTVPLPYAAAEFAWTGVETLFPAGFSAQDSDDVVVAARSPTGFEIILVNNVHYEVLFGLNGRVNVAPIALPSAPRTIVVRRATPDIQETDFQDLLTYSAAVHQQLHDAAAMRDGELRYELLRRLQWHPGDANSADTILPRWASGKFLAYNTDAGHKDIIARDLGNAQLLIPADESVDYPKLAAPPIHGTRSYLNIFVEGAIDDPTVDNRTAFEQAFAKADDYGPHAVVTGAGYLGTLGPVYWENKHRSHLLGPFTLVAMDGFVGDRIMEITNSVPDSDLMPSMGMRTRIDVARFDCRYKTRGPLIDGLYNSVLDIEVDHPLGAGLTITRAQEIVFRRLLIAGAKKRIDNAIVSAADAYNAGTAYDVGDYVFRDYPAWEDDPTSYDKGDKVRWATFLWLSLADGSVGLEPGGANNVWMKLPEFYWQAQIASTGKDPAHPSTDYTTRAPNAHPENQIWLPIYPGDAALELVTTEAGATIDNVKFQDLTFRSCDTNQLIRIDGRFASVPPSKIEACMGQGHHITQQYIDAFNDLSRHEFDAVRAIYGGTLVAPPNAVCCYVANGFAPDFIGGQLRPATLDDAKGLMIGTLGCSGNVPHGRFPGLLIDCGTDEGDRQVNIAVLESIALTPGQWNEDGLDLINTSTNGHLKVDLKGETVLSLSNVAITMPAGAVTHDFTFDPPLIGKPKLNLRPGAELKGMSYDVTALTKDGFTLTLSGEWGPVLQPAALDGNVTGKTFVLTTANQTAEWTHGYGIKHDGMRVSQPDVDVGASFRTLDTGSTTNKAVLKAPVAPDAAVVLPFKPFWLNRIPIDFPFVYDVEIPAEA